MSTINKKEQDPDQSKNRKRVNEDNVYSLEEHIVKQHTKFYKTGDDRFRKTNKMGNSTFRKTTVIKHNLEMCSKSAKKLYQSEMDRMTYDHENTVPPKLGYIIFNHTKYNTFFKNNPNCDITETHLQQFITMSTETKEVEAYIYFHNLIISNWSPTFNDIQNVFYNWGADNLNNRPVLKCKINDCINEIGLYNFELVINYISYKVLKETNGFSKTELFTLAKFTVIMSFDHYCKQMIHLIKQLFNACIRKALNEEDNTAIIEFAQELYLKHTKNDLQKIIVNLFLPIEGIVMKKMYSCLTFKLYNSFLGENTDLNAIPTDIHIWFVQYLVNKDYFKQNPTQLEGIIRLLEHVVVTFDLYQDEENLCNMYSFLYNFVRPIGKTTELVNILDRWRLGLFYLQVNQKKKMILTI